jgi:alanyl aminopeptidase
MFRPRLVAKLGNEGEDPETRRLAARLARAYLENPAAVDPSMVGTVLNLAAIDGDRSLFDLYRVRFEQAKVPDARARYLEALAAFSDPAVQAEAMKYTLAGPLRPNELFTIPLGSATSAAGRDRLFHWLSSNYGAITSRIPQAFVGFMPMAASGCSTARLEAAREFFSQPEHRGPGTDETLAKVADQVTDCANLREREGVAVARYLKRFD